MHQEPILWPMKPLDTPQCCISSEMTAVFMCLVESKSPILAIGSNMFAQAHVLLTSSPNPYLIASSEVGSDYEQLPSQWKEELHAKCRRDDCQAQVAAATTDKDRNLLLLDKASALSQFLSPLDSRGVVQEVDVRVLCLRLQLKIKRKQLYRAHLELKTLKKLLPQSGFIIQKVLSSWYNKTDNIL
ncbi:hypothetical protein DFH08DRAFT_827169 [Mycena albidolilacea]|uniref:Uncharacterized protein n=1 Tax=Mycena albidolilacea TaxID=1033008 RepID=A0AAD6YZV3_9AGAR|nr:hypothetical protein DFH08DRAFT_827169 [Mycena albidolilacea]